MLVATAAMAMLLTIACAQSDEDAADQLQLEDSTVPEDDGDMGMERIETTRDLDSFTAIRSCVPFNVLVSPGPDDVTYALIIDAEPEVAAVVSAAVNDGVLALSTTGGFNTTRAMKVTVVMPNDSLAVLEKTAAADLVVAPGFVVDSLDVLSGAAGVGRFIIVGLTAEQITIENAG